MVNKKLVEEVLELASMIKDPHFRAITYARLGYELFLLRSEEYKKAFTKAIETTRHIENPILIVRTLIEIARHLGKAKIPASSKVFHQAFEMIKPFPNPVHDELIEDIINALSELKQYDDALFYASEIRDKVRKSEVLLRLLISYVNRGNVRKAHLILENISEEPWYSIAAIEVLKAHLKREEFGSAMKILQSLKSKYWINEAMKEIAIYLKNYKAPKATFEKFVDVALSMSDELSFDALRNLLVGFGSSGEIDPVMKILRKMPPNERIKTLIELSARIIDNEELLRELMLHLDKEEFIPVAKFLLTKFLEKPDKKYINVVETLGARTGYEPILVKVVTFLAKVGEYDKALHFAHRIIDNHLRSLAFGSIAVNLLKEGDIDRAIDTALEVKDPKWSSWLLGEMLVKILELARSKEIKDDLERRAKEQKALW
ncbi:hypothetical protein E3E31_02150 [Thermococcus sp. M39]|uniref:hypothetical protein n=1 Tax=unclassified Thermococcus TaxID=2627626 RepID=UPI0014390EFF|nr:MULTISPECIES: hypothetical protein [unclassified Thermococcus]NJE07349.1 hypothetical protein [Thermococcus sp. M39]NJE12520.1 hypothetical protein [Thermococcus sp. LS2]